MPYRCSRVIIAPKPSFITCGIWPFVRLMSPLDIILRNCEEVVTHDELKTLIAEKKEPSAYIGFEPSGLVHIGWNICLNKIKDLLDSNFKVTVLLADWHAYLNDKLGGDIDNIRACGEYIKDVFSAFNIKSEKLDFVYASDLLDGMDYWEKVLRVSKKSSLSRIKRTLTIMGRQEGEADLDASKLIYPAMQAADIFQLDVDVALGGMDQRKAHMLARDVSEKLGWRKVVALHTPLLSGIQGGGRMEPTEAKMSKSNPETSIFIHDSPEDIERKIKKAYCPEGELADNPIIEICRYIIFNDADEFVISRPEKFGGDMHIGSYKELEDVYTTGQLHPQDLKNATAKKITDLLEPVRQFFQGKSANYEHVKALVVTR